jgi:hypothetical protein
MAEKVYTHHRHEQDKPAAEAFNHDVEKLDELVEQGRHSRHEHAEQLEDIRAEAKEQAISTSELIASHTEVEQSTPASPLINKDLKDIKYQRTLQSVRNNLSVPERVLSKTIHNPVVDAVSSIAEKTVARPSGILAGGITAFVGSSVFLWIVKHYGYEYNFLLFALLFAAGFVVGLLIEAVLRIIRRRS